MGASDRIHRTKSDDGTEIAGRVHGQGPPLVLVHGGLEDGDIVWSALLPFLRDRFTCYTMSTRSRGLSGASDDLSRERLVQDVAAFAESIGDAVGLVGESSGGMLALGAAARTHVSAVAVYEPTVFEVFAEENAALLQENIAVVGDLVAHGRMADAARTFAEPLVTDDELAAVSASGYFEDSGRYVPVLLGEIEQAADSEDESPTDPSVLSRISAPVLVMYGSRTALRSWFMDGVGHVAEHVADARVREIPGAGHWGPVLHPQPIAEELVRFFAEELQRA